MQTKQIETGVKVIERERGRERLWEKGGKERKKQREVARVRER